MDMAGVRGTDFKLVGEAERDEDLRKLHGWNLGPTALPRHDTAFLMFMYSSSRSYTQLSFPV